MTWKALIRGRVFNMGRRVALFVSTCTTTKVTETCITHTFICARLVLLPPLSAACDEEKTDRRRARAKAISWRNTESRGHCRVGRGGAGFMCILCRSDTICKSLLERACDAAPLDATPEFIPKRWNDSHHYIKVIDPERFPHWRYFLLQ